MAGVDKTLVRNLVILHTAVIALSNYLVTIRFDLFPGADPHCLDRSIGGGGIHISDCCSSNRLDS